MENVEKFGDHGEVHHLTDQQMLLEELGRIELELMQGGDDEQKMKKLEDRKKEIESILDEVEDSKEAV